MEESSFGWNLDRYLKEAESNRHVQKEVMAPWFSAFQEIVIAQNAIMAPHVIKADGLLVSKLLANNAFTHFVAAVDVGLSGQYAPCFALQRVCIESVVYAYSLVKAPAPSADWLLRDTYSESKKKTKQAFKITDLMKNMPGTDTETRKEVVALYDQAIGQGAHPNVVGALADAEVSMDDEHVRVRREFFTKGYQLYFALIATMEVGYVMVYLEDLMFELHFAPPTFPERMAELWAGVPRDHEEIRGDVPE